MRNFLPFLTTLLPLASAIQCPNLEGFKVVWQDDFNGCQGCAPSKSNWNVALDINTNNELQEYTESNRNIQLSGGHTLQLVPWKGDKGEWTSGRIESKKSWFAKEGKAMRVEASLRTGEAAHKQGVWPAFWMLGDAMRKGTEWPLCGELDIFERVNGDLTGYGTVHCGHEGGGPCNEPEGLGQAVPIPDNSFHTWSIVVDRRPQNWQAETITWLMDGAPFHSLTGAQLGDQGTWATLAHSPMYILLNVAVGGNWPGDPNAATQSGYDNMMEVSYVAVYETA
ncbi:endo-13(4)-beta-glucanase [Fusarium albosuccineum]|uniref:Endo-13(4)-beta-glucanase n=1 Tax=Fusarium albosuccineum TaxID=1237068 RepID=A0A8H4LNR5_9HYPO|nr:endo-13(4)-beta-glucanase [Fusarium albosuccineum]